MALGEHDGYVDFVSGHARAATLEIAPSTSDRPS